MSSLYYYTARSPQGSVIRGSLEARNESAALAGLRTRALFVTSLEHSGSARGNIAAACSFGSVSERAMVTFFRCFATLVRSGVAMRRALEVSIAECRDKRLEEALRALHSDIESGFLLSESMQRRPKEFERVLIVMVRAGELGGVLDRVLDDLATLLERNRAARKRIAAALTYPVVVGTSALALVVFLMTSIVPMFRSMYRQMDVPVPAITAALITAGTMLRSPGLWIAIALCALAASAAVRVLYGNRGAAALERILLALPLFGAIRRKGTIARLARTLGALLACGAGLVASLEVVGDVVMSPLYRQSLNSLRLALSEGSTLSEPLARTGLYDPMFIQMLRAGEETGRLDTMLLHAAQYYDLDVEVATSALGATLEPALILLLGTAVGCIVGAIFIPFYTLIGNIR